MPAAPITVNVIADSITDGGDRLTTFEWTYPRHIHSEVLTHGMLRRNSASSRAIPAAKLRARVLEAPAYPGSWGKNQRGMQAFEEVEDTAAAEAWWLRGRDLMAAHHEEGEQLGLAKQVVNRVIEPWMMITIVITATEWANFFHLRKHKDAEPSFQKLATLAWESYHEHMPVYRPPGPGSADLGLEDEHQPSWHLPFVDFDTEIDVAHKAPIEAMSKWLREISTGRCARVSYLTHNGVRDVVDDVALHDKLIASAKDGGPMHMSPFEHPCMATGDRRFYGPFKGWKQFRKFIPGEAGPTTVKCAACGCWNGNHVKVCPLGEAQRAGERPPSLAEIRAASRAVEAYKRMEAVRRRS
jgi:hypothetical protein